MTWYAAKVGWASALVDGRIRMTVPPVIKDGHVLIEARSHEVFGHRVSYNPLSRRVFVFDRELAWPTPARAITDGFGPRVLRGKDDFHSGVDFPVRSGTEVRAALPGRLYLTGFDPGGFGRFVVLDHGAGLFSLYAHLTTAEAAEQVAAGQVVGLSGATGKAFGPHLHLALYATGAYFPLTEDGIFNKAAAVDPWPLFGEGVK